MTMRQIFGVGQFSDPGAAEAAAAAAVAEEERRLRPGSSAPISGRLSEKCRKAAIQDPCSQLAAQEAAKRCAAQKGKPYGAYGRCMNANFELQLISKCGQIVCPGDPFMLEDTGTSAMSRTTQSRADEGGLYSTHEDEIGMRTQFENEGEAGGVDPSKMRLYLGLGIGVVVLLIMARK